MLKTAPAQTTIQISHVDSVIQVKFLSYAVSLIVEKKREI